MYEFPRIEGYDDVKSAIDNKFVVRKTGDLLIVNYILADEETFPSVTDYETAVRREFRGITFDARSGKLLARKYHKFFNIGEREETSVENLVWTNHIVMEKLDGSMITPVLVRDRLEWHTKMGFTDVARKCLHLVNRNHIDFAHDVISAGFTSIFEFVSRRNRIVVDYPEENLILTAIRNNITGQYLPYDEMAEIAANYGIPVVNVYGNVKDILKFLEEARKEKEKEGYVIRFSNGHMVKVKNEWYVQLHRTIANISITRYTMALLLNEKLDDVLAFMPKDIRENIELWSGKVLHEIRKTAEDLRTFLVDVEKKVEKSENPRKEFAVTYARELEPFTRAVAFKLFGKTPSYQDVFEELKKSILNNTSSTKMLMKAKHVWKHEVSDYLTFNDE